MPKSVTDWFSEYREAFALFDKRGTGQVPRESLGELLRSLGQNPTQAEVAGLERDIGATCMYNVWAVMDHAKSISRL